MSGKLKTLLFRFLNGDEQFYCTCTIVRTRTPEYCAGSSSDSYQKFVYLPSVLRIGLDAEPRHKLQYAPSLQLSCSFGPRSVSPEDFLQSPSQIVVDQNRKHTAKKGKAPHMAFKEGLLPFAGETLH